MQIRTIFTTAVVLIFGLRAAAQAPSNDLCSGAIDLSTHLGYAIGELQITDTYSNMEATGEAELVAALGDDWVMEALQTTVPVWIKACGFT